MDCSQHHKIISVRWNIANDVLRGVFGRAKYGEVILPMADLRWAHRANG